MLPVSPLKTFASVKILLKFVILIEPLETERDPTGRPIPSFAIDFVTLNDST